MSQILGLKRLLKSRVGLSKSSCHLPSPFIFNYFLKILEFDKSWCSIQIGFGFVVVRWCQIHCSRKVCRTAYQRWLPRDQIWPDPLKTTESSWCSTKIATFYLGCSWWSQNLFGNNSNRSSWDGKNPKIATQSNSGKNPGKTDSISNKAES